MSKWDKVGNWILGIPRPLAATMPEWRRWNAKAKAARPVRYWLSETALDTVQDVVTWPRRKLRDANSYVSNRWVTHSHALTSHPRDIPRGRWCDLDSRILYCLFNELVNFVEVESAWMLVICDDDAMKKYGGPKWWCRRAWRSPEAGIAHLDWAASLVNNEDMGLKPGDKGYGEMTGQAKGAVEILSLYRWWTEVYPNRPEPMDASGWTALCDADRAAGIAFFDDEAETAATRAAKNSALKRCSKIEADYTREDTEMLTRLIKVRNHLWT